MCCNRQEMPAERGRRGQIAERAQVVLQDASLHTTVYITAEDFDGGILDNQDSTNLSLKFHAQDHITFGTVS